MAPSPPKPSIVPSSFFFSRSLSLSLALLQQSQKTTKTQAARPNRRRRRRRSRRSPHSLPCFRDLFRQVRTHTHTVQDRERQKSSDRQKDSLASCLVLDVRPAFLSSFRSIHSFDLSLRQLLSTTHTQNTSSPAFTGMRIVVVVFFVVVYGDARGLTILLPRRPCGVCDITGPAPFSFFFFLLGGKRDIFFEAARSPEEYTSTK